MKRPYEDEIPCDLAVDFRDQNNFNSQFCDVGLFTVLRDTQKASLISFNDGKETWIPKKFVKDGKIQRWILQKKGLTGLIVTNVPVPDDGKTISLAYSHKVFLVVRPYSTCYGFQVLTSGVSIQYAGVPVELRENLLSVLGDLGGVDALYAKQLKFSPLAFRKCSPHLTVLLWNMLRLSNGGVKAKSKALEVLGELADSRAIGKLHRYVEIHKSAYHRSKEYRLVEECFLCLSRIGSHHSFEIVRGIPTEIGNIALGGIRHPTVQKVFEQETNRSLRFHPHKMVQLLKALSNTRSRHWLSFYEVKRQKYRPGVVNEAIDHAERNVHPSFDME